MSRDYFRHIERHDSLNARKRECHGCASTHSSRKARRTRGKVQEVPIKNSSICRFVVGVAYPAMPKSLSPLVSLPRYAPSLTLSRQIIPNPPRSDFSRPVICTPQNAKDEPGMLATHLLTTHLRMTMRTLHGPTKKQLPIPPSRAIKTYAVRNPIPFLDVLSAIWAFRLVVRAQEERHSHRKRKNHPDNAYR